MEFMTKEELLASLKDTDPGRREKAVAKIGTLEDPSLVPYLLEILSDDVPRVRWRVVQAVGKLGAEADIADGGPGVTGCGRSYGPVSGRGGGR